MNKVGVVVLEASEEFEKYEAHKLGLRDVFKLRHNYLNSLVGPSKELENPTNEEIEQYIKAREEYIADAILKECGWEEYIKRCKKMGILPSKCPCEGLGGQCNMFCNMYLKGCCK